MSVVGILISLGLLVWLAYRGWTILLLAPLCALIAALLAGQPLLANWTQTFMSNAAGFVAQFFPIFLLGALFGKLMEASGSVEAIAGYLTGKRVLDESKVPGVLAVMATAGLYDDSGKWLYRTGLPAKSGVGGGIIAPRRCPIRVPCHRLRTAIPPNGAAWSRASTWRACSSSSARGCRRSCAARRSGRPCPRK